MHRKFITLILATSIAVTSLSAAPAFADGKTARQFGWLALLGIVALAVQDNKRKNSVTHNNYTYSTPAKPLPPSVSSKSLPGQCLSAHNVNGQYRKLFGRHCLRQNSVRVSALPHACQLGYSNGRSNRVGYEPLCLREHGYRATR